jgi:SNF2 family DNA or RNA helicase
MTDFKEPKLWKHQLEGVRRATQDGVNEFAFIYDVGTGKTLTCITTLRRIYSKESWLMPTLILSPKVTLDNWKNEWEKFSKIPSERVVVLKGPVKKRIKLLEEKIEKYKGNIIVITNYEGIRTKELYKAVLVKFRPQVLVCDESHRCKQHNSKTTKAVTDISRNTKYRYLLTGTLVTNSEFDVFSQWRILDKGKRFGKNFYHFRNKYFFDKNYGMPSDKHFPDWQIRKGAYDNMQKYIDGISLKAIKEECIDLPDLVKKDVFIEMSTEQKRIYKELKTVLISEIKEGEFATAETALTKALRLAQVASGFIKTEEGEIRRLKNEREAALKELLSDLCATNNKVIVWCVFKENYAQVREVCESLNLKYKEGHGEVKDVASEVADFDSGDYDVLIGHPASIGIGVNIKSASTAIYFSRNFSLEQRLQSEARNYRGGSIEIHNKITQIDIICKDTIDEQISQALTKKLVTATKILDLVRSSL